MSRIITREHLHIEIAKLISQRSGCQRGQVGAVITSVDNRIICTGYNGPLPHSGKCTDKCNIDNPCTHSIHAEANAIAFAAKNGITLNGAILYCTTSPCIKCSELIIQSGIWKVVYDQNYRDPAGLELLCKNKIQVIGINAFDKYEL